MPREAEVFFFSDADRPTPPACGSRTGQHTQRGPIKGRCCTPPLLARFTERRASAHTVAGAGVRACMSCRAFGGGLLVGALLGSTTLLNYGQTETPRDEWVMAEGHRPHALQPLDPRLSGFVPPPSDTQLAAAPPKAAARATLPSAVPATKAPSITPKSARYHSVGKLRALPKSVDIALPGNARHVVEHRSFNREIIMFTSDHQMIGWAAHWVNQMRQRGYEHWMILGDKPETCA